MSVMKPRGDTSRFSIKQVSHPENECHYLNMNAETRSPHVQTSYRGDSGTQPLQADENKGTLGYGLDTDTD
jgi:hypothetical protein